MLRAALSLGEAIYGYEIARRNRNFDLRLGVHRASVPVISVGNLTAGGTGKTPVVAYIANHFRRWGVDVALLSRGYRAQNHASGGTLNDEALVLEHLCPGVPHIQQRDRVAGAAAAVSRFGSELLILDDGFQHRRLARDLDIVLIDATNPFGFGHLLPRGLLREPVEALQRADLVLLTRADCVSAPTRARIVDVITKVDASVPVVEVSFPPARLVNASGETRPLEALEEVPTLAFCGIGNPVGFEATLRSAGLHPTEVISFRDHHHYVERDMNRLALRADACGVAAAVTTLKDLVKIRSDVLPPPSGAALWAVETECRILSNAERLTERLDGLIRKVASPKAA